MPTNKLLSYGLASAMLALLAAPLPVAAETLRILTWGGYAPEDVVAAFTEETGIDVEVTLSNNEEMISKLRATGGSGFDLAQPSQDRILGPQLEFGIYKPIDISQIDESQFISSMLAATKENTTVEGEIYGLPHVWGTDGLVLDSTQAGDVKDYMDLCNADYAGKVSYRLRRPVLIAFAFSMGLDPFAAYNDPDAYKAILDQVETKLTECKANVKAYWAGGDEIRNLLASGEVVAAMAWDTGGWSLNAENPNITFVAPTSGALGWIDTFALPSGGENDAAAYKWINFVMRPDISAMITAAAGNFTASKGADELADPALKARYQASFPPEAVDNINWYPPVPAGLESMEGEVLDRVGAS